MIDTDDSVSDSDNDSKAYLRVNPTRIEWDLKQIEGETTIEEICFVNFTRDLKRTLVSSGYPLKIEIWSDQASREYVDTWTIRRIWRDKRVLVYSAISTLKFLAVNASEYWFLRVLTSGVAFLHAGLRVHPCSICLPPKYRSSNDAPYIETPRTHDRVDTCGIDSAKSSFRISSLARGEVCKFGASNSTSEYPLYANRQSAWQTHLQASFAYELGKNDFYYAPHTDTIGAKFNICMYEIHTNVWMNGEVFIEIERLFICFNANNERRHYNMYFACLRAFYFFFIFPFNFISILLLYLNIFFDSSFCKIFEALYYLSYIS